MNSRKKKVCLITPNHISTNPRLVKEAMALEDSGFSVHLIFTQSDSFETRMDYAILNQHPEWTFDALDWSGKNIPSSFSRFASGVYKKFCEKIFTSTTIKSFSSGAVNRHLFWQIKKAVSAKADIYIAHNIAALPVARIAARKTKAKFGFDAEDFHRNETTNDPTAKDVLVKSVLEEKNLKNVDHFTAASPLIAKAYQNLFPQLRPTVVLNVFPKTELPQPTLDTERPLRLFWFSQTIGQNRGIEVIIDAIGKSTRKNYELHLLGNAVPAFKEKILQQALGLGLKNQIFFYDPVPEKEIFHLASTCDIGLASETGIPYNRDICLTNKIFTYIQSGLAIAASDTSAQIKFVNDYPSTGKIYQKNDATSLANVLDYYAENRDGLNDCRKKNFELGQTFLNWENEQQKFIEQINSLTTLKKQLVLN